MNLPIQPIINGQDIERVYEIKYLGVIIDPKLKFDANFQYVKKKILKKICFLQRNKHKFDLKTKLVILKSLISPHVDYCSSVLFLATETQLRELQLLQNRAMRSVLKCGNRTSIDDMLQRLNLLDIKQRIYFNVLVMIHKLKIGLLPTYLSQNLQYVRDVQPYSLRSNEMFRLPNYIGGQAQNSLFYKGVSLYNSLSNHMPLSNNINEFKNDLVNYVRISFSSH